MKPLRILLCAATALALFACSDDSGPGVGTGDAGDADTMPNDAGGDGAVDTNLDQAVDNGEDGGGDTGDDGQLDQGGDTGGGAFSSCVVDPDGEECGNGLDDDCNGLVDEACGCTPEGSMQSCYLGAGSDLDASNARCQAGSQSCQLEFWTTCSGAVGPIAEDCETALDDNCDGEVNEGCELEGPTAICPADFEDDVLSTYSLTGDYELIDGDQIITFFWTQVSAPPGHSFDITSSGDTITWFADVAGQYTFRFTVTSDNGTDTCETVFTARTADALRIEMFWNPDYEESEGLPRDRSDFDLYLLREPGAGGDSCGEDADCPGYTDFPGGQACNLATDTCEFYYYRDNPEQVGLPNRGYANPDACHWRNCNTCPTGIENDAEFADHPCQDLAVDDLVRECLCRFTLSNPPVGTTPEDIYPAPVLDWGTGVEDDDPRLDLDDTEGKGPENVNVRTPEAGTYRVAVHFFDPDGFGDAGADNFRTSPVQVRILCGGEVEHASAQVVLGSRDDIPFGYWQSDLWEVGDLVVSYDGSIQCDFTAFETEGCLHICSLGDSDGGCEPSEFRRCE